MKSEQGEMKMDDDEEQDSQEPTKEEQFLSDRLHRNYVEIRGLEEKVKELEQERDRLVKNSSMWRVRSDVLLRERDEARAEADKRARKAEENYDLIKEQERLTDEWKRRAEELQTEVDILRKANLDRYGTTEATELIQVRAEVERLKEDFAEADSEWEHERIRDEAAEKSLAAVEARAKKAERLLAEVVPRHLMHCPCDDCIEARAFLKDSQEKVG